MSLQIQLSPEAQAILHRIGTPAYVLRGIAAALDFENQLTLTNIVQNHLRGKGPYPVEQHRLGERSHQYWKSVKPSKAVVSGNAVESFIGANVKYAAVHEEGFQGTVQVAPHLRRAFDTREFLGRENKKTKRRSVVSRRVRLGDRNVGTHTRKMNIPARRPLATGVEERLDAYGRGISAGIVNAWNTHNSDNA